MSNLKRLKKQLEIIKATETPEERSERLRRLRRNRENGMRRYIKRMKRQHTVNLYLEPQTRNAISIYCELEELDWQKQAVLELLTIGLAVYQKIHKEEWAATIEQVKERRHQLRDEFKGLEQEIEENSKQITREAESLLGLKLDVEDKIVEEAYKPELADLIKEIKL